MMGMPLVFNADVAGDLQDTIEFVLGGTGGGIYHLRIADGQCIAQRGSLPNASLSINAPAQTWMAIARGELDGQQAFMDGDMRAKGDMNIMAKLSEMFNTGTAPGVPGESDESATVQTTKASAQIEAKSCRDIVMAMAGSLNPQAARELRADIQFNVSGQEPGTYFLQIDNGRCRFHEGTSFSPALTINTPSDTWIAVSNGQVEGATAFMESQYTAEGDFALLMKMSQLFETAA